jgi:outer membrane protein assembly factor BamA
MRSRLAQFVLVTWLFTGVLPADSQSQASQEISPPSKPCSATSPHDEPSSGPEISIANVTFSGFIQMPVPDQEDIAAAVKRDTRGSDLNSLVEEALERIRAGWQDRGYFKVKISGDARNAPKTENNTQIALFVHVDENAQYRLRGIGFKNNKAIWNSAAMRALFPIKDGDIFSREKIAEGLEKLRKLYGEYGYVNYTGVPVTTFDEENKLANLDIDIDEGKQFYVSDISFEGSTNLVGSA